MLQFIKQWPLFLTIGVALVAIEQTGFLNGWSSPILAQLQQPNSTIPVSSDEGSWIATILPLVSFIATPIPAMCMHYFGRKIGFLIAIFPISISWIMIALATTSTELIIARGIAGFVTTFLYTIVPVYLGEISPDRIRGFVGICMNVMQNIGILWIYWFGTYSELWISSLACLSPILIVALFYKWLPESPYYLYEKNQIDKAKHVLEKLKFSNIQRELEKIQSTVNIEKDKNGLKEIFCKKQHRRALIICMGTFSLAQLTGGITFMFYAHLIFQKAGDVSANTMSIIKAILQLITSVLAAFVVDILGRKPLLIISCLGSSIFMFSLGIYFYLLDYNYNVDSIWWLPLTSMILFNISQVIGLTPISLTYLGEMFHPSVKSIGVCISKAWLALHVFIVGKLFQVLTDYFGNSVPFFVFAVVGVIGVFFIMFVVPETKGKSLEEIQYYLEHKHYRHEIK